MGRTSIGGMLAYAAPTAGLYFFYIPMFSILPEVYAKYYAIPMSTVALIVLSIRMFDGLADTTVGYCSDWHRARGGSRKIWTLLGCIGSTLGCYFLFDPPKSVTAGYYLMWSLVYFLALATADIPHLAWGGELSQDYESRARIFGVRTLVVRLGIAAFYALPLMPSYQIHEYTPEVLHDAVVIGAFLSMAGLAYMFVAAPEGVWSGSRGHNVVAGSLFTSIVRNKPLIIHFFGFGAVCLSYGMWFGLLVFFLDGYLHLGGRVPIMFLVGWLCAALSTPLWVKLINTTSKSVAWSLSVALFVGQLVALSLLSPGGPFWPVLVLMLIANVCLAGNDTAALAILGDVVDYGKLRFGRQDGGIYFALNAVFLKLGLGLGGGLAIGIAGVMGFDVSHVVHTQTEILGLRLALIALPSLLGLVGIVLILRAPLTRKRCAIIHRRLERLAGRTEHSRRPDSRITAQESLLRIPDV